MGHFKEKICWVVGASSGIGKELAIQLSNDGAIVVLSARNETALNSLKQDLPNSNRHYVFPLDLEDLIDRKPDFDLMVKELGGLHYLFNNGGLSQRSTAGETSIEVDRRIMEINYFGNITLSKWALPIFRKQQFGHLLIVSSIAGKFGFFLRSAYSASKHALHGYYESLRLEEESNSIHVTIVCPGKINTPISLNALTEKGEKHGVMDHNQDTGMPVEECVRQILTAVKMKKKEVLIGGKEVWAAKIKRLFPGLFYRIIRKQSAT